MARANQWATHVKRLAPAYQLVWASRTEPAFHAAVESSIEAVLRRIEAARKSYGRLDEPGLSQLTADLLHPLVAAHAEKNRNGHVDFVIEHPEGQPWVYPVECKIWRGHAWHREGMVQLLGYATSFDKRGMCLAFFVNEQKMAFLLRRERAEIEGDTECPVVDVCTDHPSVREGFISLHEHRSGMRFQIVHGGCDLYSGGAEAPG